VRPSVAATIALVSVLLGARVADAQATAPTEEARVEARREFAAGLAAAESQRWADALGHFERVYERVRAPNVLLNIAGALVAVGRLVDAASRYEQYLREAPESEASLREEAQRSLANARARLGMVVLRINGLSGTDEVSIDANTIERSALAGPIAVDPGPHRVTVLRQRTVVAQQSFTVAESTRREVLLRVQGGRPLWQSPWLWTAVGAVVVGAGVTVGVVYERSTALFVGNVPPGFVEVR
jgi:hypothetical protein